MGLYLCLEVYHRYSRERRANPATSQGTDRAAGFAALDAKYFRANLEEAD